MSLLTRTKPDVGRLRRRRKLDGLRNALQYREPFVDDEGSEWDLGVEVRVQAAEALADFDGPAVAADLSTALEDPEPAVRLAAIDSIAKLGMRVAGHVEQLVGCAASRERGTEEVGARALDLLVEWKSYGTAELLVDSLLQPGAPEPDEGHREALERLLTADFRGSAARDTVADGLIAQLQERNADHTEEAAERILGWLGPAAIEKVLGALDDGNAAPGVVRVAGLMGDARAIDPVVRGLESSDAEMRTAAATAAHTLNHTRAVPALLTATQDDDQQVRDAASAALDRMGTAAVIAGLAAVVSARGLLAPVPADAELDEATAEELYQGATARAAQPDGPEPAYENHDSPTSGSPAAEERPSAPEPTPERPAEPAPPAPQHPPHPGRRRTGGFFDRLFGRD